MCFMDFESIVIFACMLAFTEYRSGAQFRSIQANFPHDLSLTWVDRSFGEECRVTGINLKLFQ